MLKAIREAVGSDMVIELRVSATEGIPGGLEFEESLAFMELAQEYVDIMHVSQGSIFHLSARYTIPTYFREPHKPLNVDYAAEVKKHLHIPVAVVGMITTLEEAEDIIASGKADIVAMAKSFMADGDIIHKSLAGESAEVRPCTRCDLCGNANTYGTAMSCAINPRCGIAGEIEQLPEAERKNVMVIGGGPAGMMAAQTLVKRGHTVTLYEKADKLGGLLIDASMVPFKQLMREYLDWDIKETLNCGAKIVLNTAVTESLIEQEDPDAIIVATGSVYVNPPIPGMDSALAVRDVDSHAVEPGKNVVVCGGGITGLERAGAGPGRQNRHSCRYAAPRELRHGNAHLQQGRSAGPAGGEGRAAHRLPEDPVHRRRRTRWTPTAARHTSTQPTALSMRWASSRTMRWVWPCWPSTAAIRS